MSIIHVLQIVKEISFNNKGSFLLKKNTLSQLKYLFLSFGKVYNNFKLSYYIGGILYYFPNYRELKNNAVTQNNYLMWLA